ncbi:hypothetical protein AAFF_G00127830 [Aldrovandia affinis]|uniref:G-protein coupled receptors family 1 profile domain-containing protein n=1 Tax=Aldrovandia affinis TaxID=143900 RepID=A0AAD7T282_9TELE|nr:hypothetical protein AAFF_G00127830 [Aldrovandia affinis]
MDNVTYNNPVLLLEGIDLPPRLIYPVFILLLLTYLIILTTNIGIILLVSIDRNLQQPMYLLFCNLSFNDILGNMALLPRLMFDVISTDKSIGYAACVTQAFFSHTFGTSAHMVMMIMAFDRYVAICHPLRYTSIMTPAMVVKLSVSAWGTTLTLVSVLIGLTLRLTRCRSVIHNAYCDNASLFKLSCQDVSINNIYGLTFTVVLLGSSMGSIAFTYIRILAICLTRKSKQLKSKAMQTCASHLVLYMIMLWSGFLAIISHRLQIPTGVWSQALMANMENVSHVPLKQPIVFTLEGFIVTKEGGYPLFVISLIVYIVILVGNGTVLLVIITNKKLHRPMYIMICNLAACDLLGGTAVMTRLMFTFLTGEKTITYVAAIFQAFCVHTYGSAVATILSAMAYDRYIAICKPLHYHTILTTERLVALCLLAWFIARFKDVSPNAKKFCTILFIIVPPAINPIIYGIITKEIRTNVIRLFKSTVSPK